MTKRAVQLQTELLTDEDFDLFLMNKGLLVIEIYTEWCGPCLGIVNGLLRIKYDLGDRIIFAIARSDTISYINRFYRRSEPTWLFVNEGRAVNIMFGADYPKLCKLIFDEIRMLTKQDIREHYGVSELLPEEEKRDRMKNEAKARKIREETAAKERKKARHFMNVTDTILDNLPYIGVTIFGPQVNRDLYRKLIEVGYEKLGIQCKDRRNQAITKEQFEFINTVCTNPLPADVIDILDGKELFICYWKSPDNSNIPISDSLELYAEEVTKKPILPPDEYRDTEGVQPPLVSPLKLVVEYDKPDDQECPSMHESDLEIPINRKSEHEIIDPAMEETEMDSEENEELPDDNKHQSMIDIERSEYGSHYDIEEDDEYVPQEPKKNICKKIVEIPGIWVPKDSRTHAALIYVLFRAQTLGFLPPEPMPEPPHVIMAFNTYKDRDLIEFADRYKDDIPSYGYFTSDDADEAKFIASNKKSYAKAKQSPSDKLVFKVNKRTSHTMLSLVRYGPTYVSFDTTIGKQEAHKFFPDPYLTPEQEVTQSEEAAKMRNKKRGSNKDQKDKDNIKVQHGRRLSEAITRKESSRDEGRAKSFVEESKSSFPKTVSDTIVGSVNTEQSTSVAVPNRPTITEAVTTSA